MHRTVLLLLAGCVLHSTSRTLTDDTRIEITGSKVLSPVSEPIGQGIQLQCLQACKGSAQFALNIPGDEVITPRNCTVQYSLSASNGTSTYAPPTAYTHFFMTRSHFHTFHVQGLESLKQYSLQVTCDRLKSSVIPLTIQAKCQEEGTDIEVLLENVCASTASLEWLFFPRDSNAKGLNSCCVRFDLHEQFMANISHIQLYKFLPNNGIFKLFGLIPGRQYSLDVSCGTSRSNVTTFSASDVACTGENKSDVESEVPVMFEDKSSLFSSKYSILGIVFGLCGFLIIIVTSFYVLRKVRRRQRLQRIRRYLGSSLVDPFENLEIRMPHDDSSSERLMGSPDM